MDSARVVVYIGVCLSVLSTVCKSEMSPENRVSAQEEQYQLGYVTRDLVRTPVIFNICG